MAEEHRDALRARIGLAFVTSGWFREVGVQAEQSETTARIDRIAAQIRGRLEEFLDPVGREVICSVDQARKAGAAMREADVNGVLLVPLMWCEDQIVRALLGEVAGRPVMLWTFSPSHTLPEHLTFQNMLQGSGPVCALQASGMLKREGRDVIPVVGSLEEPEVYEEIAVHSTGLALRRAFGELAVGVLPFPCSYMSTTYVDEFDLRSRYGIELRYIELERVRRTAAETAPGDLADFREELFSSRAEIQVDERNLAEGIRYALALEGVMAQEELSALAMNDVMGEMHRSFGLRPCLSNPRLSGRGAVIAMEADVAAAVCMYALRRFTGASPFYTEVMSVDHDKNALLLGHAGYHDAANADPANPVRIVSDLEYENSDRFSGCVSCFKYRPGPVTVVNSVWDGAGLKWMAFEGLSLEGGWKLEGSSHLFCRLEPDVKQFFRRAVRSGVSQHWIVVPGRIMGSLEALCGALDVRFVGLPPSTGTPSSTRSASRPP